ncbi:MAG: hypothetical protein J6J23_00020 [Clostridia bacterium]|nr:hypothetical protein [Clostridia bacterium]
MGSGGVPSGGVVIVHGRNGALMYKNAKPNSRCDLYVNGEKIQSRWYDSKGRAMRNRDYKHQDIFKNHKFPHDHVWEWRGEKGIRSENWEDPDYIHYI